MNIVIMAGGGGTRLWPLSRDKFPKQFTQIFGKKTLLQHTFDRALKIVGKPENIVVTTRQAFVKEISKQLKRLPKENILVESVKRDTAPSIGMAAAYLASKGRHDEAMLLMPSDPYFRNPELYCEAVGAIGKFLDNHAGATVLLGSEPSYPETGYGYIELKSKKISEGKNQFNAVKRFREKPDLEKAKKFVNSGKFVWNMGVYGWRVNNLLHMIHEFAPEIASRLDEIQTLFQEKKLKKISEVYEKMPSISIDFAVTEKQDPQSIFVLKGDYGWSDIGHWGAIQELMGGKEGLELKKGIAVQINSSGNFVYNTAEKAIGLAGIHDLVVVSTKDALLICDKKNVQDVKKLVEEFGKIEKGVKYI